MKNNRQEAPLEIGWKEWVSLPGLEVPAIKAKVDTGARTSALHAFYLRTYREQGRDMVEFHIHPLQRKTSLVLVCTAPVLDVRTVRDSGGHEEVRNVIMTDVKLSNRQWPIEVTLTNRDDMMFRMLLGRTALRSRNIIVIPGRSYLTGKTLNQAYRKSKAR